MSRINENHVYQERKPKFPIAEPHDLSPRSKWLRNYFYKGLDREWNNQTSPFTTGTDWDIIFHEGDWYINPEVHYYIQILGKNDQGVFASSYRSMAIPVELPDNFWELSLPERRAKFLEKVMLEYIPHEIISENDLIAGGRFNAQLSRCFNEEEAKEYWKKNIRNREVIFKYHKSGFGNLGAVPGHIIPDYETIVKNGFKYIFEKARKTYDELSKEEKGGPKGGELRAIMTSAELPKKLAKKYAEECRRLKMETKNPERIEELEQMAKNLEIVPWEPAKTFWQGVQAVWLIHMIIMAEESYPGAGLSFGRIDQYLWDLYRNDVIEQKTITKEFAKDILGSFWFHSNTVYDAMIRIGKQGITSAFGQIITLSGCGLNGEDLTNELTYTMIEIIDSWYPNLVLLLSFLLRYPKVY